MSVIVLKNGDRLEEELVVVPTEQGETMIKSGRFLLNGQRVSWLVAFDLLRAEASDDVIESGRGGEGDRNLSPDR